MDYKPLSITINFHPEDTKDMIAMKFVRAAIEGYLDDPIARIRVLDYCLNKQHDLLSAPQMQEIELATP